MTRRGFSLIELIAVVAVTAIVSLVSVNVLITSQIRSSRANVISQVRREGDFVLTESTFPNAMLAMSGRISFSKSARDEMSAIRVIDQSGGSVEVYSASTIGWLLTPVPSSPTRRRPICPARPSKFHGLNFSCRQDPEERGAYIQSSISDRKRQPGRSVIRILLRRKTLPGMSMCGPINKCYTGGMSAQSGQVGIAVLLIMVVLSTIGISIAARSTQDVQSSRQTQEAVQTFAAAEAALEDILSRGSTYLETTTTGEYTGVENANVDYTIAQQTQLSVDLLEGSVAEVNVTGAVNGQQVARSNGVIRPTAP